MDLVRIPAGEFLMGSTADVRDAENFCEWAAQVTGRDVKLLTEV